VGESVVGQAEAQVEHGGHDAVGEGEGKWPTGAGLVPRTPDIGRSFMQGLGGI
jgi:hypothetical protein